MRPFIAHVTDGQVGLVNWCLAAFSAQTGYIVPQEYEVYHVGRETGQTHHNTMKQYIKPRKS